MIIIQKFLQIRGKDMETARLLRAQALAVDGRDQPQKGLACLRHGAHRSNTTADLSRHSVQFFLGSKQAPDIQHSPLY